MFDITRAGEEKTTNNKVSSNLFKIIILHIPIKGMKVYD